MKVTTIPTPLTINTDDLTLAELDRVVRLAEVEKRCGRTSAIAFVYLKREHPSVRMEDVLALKARDLDLVTDDDLAARAEDSGEDSGDVAVDPTPGLS